ncbi:hypothetical protein BS47DRAFT_1402489 [Hydnum rufescens UP504]|uniref:Uncharacterized protein n=1 Tax=Hydnum rufescens UP504 TaxID=1448309 RepID=A0A9P6ADU2_9AGAM|nr:hypothetical protein BS47DRAFT_1402489 [Hydnum rufescens UP504]
MVLTISNRSATSLLALVTSLLTLISPSHLVTTLLALGTVPHALMISPLNSCDLPRLSVIRPHRSELKA